MDLTGTEFGKKVNGFVSSEESAIVMQVYLSIKGPWSNKIVVQGSICSRRHLSKYKLVKVPLYLLLSIVKT